MTLPSARCAWYTSYCSLKFGAPVSSMTASASAVVPITKPGVSMRVSGSTTSVAPIASSARAAQRRVAISAARARAGQLARERHRRGYARAKLVDAFRIGGDPAIALREIAGGQVEEHLRQPVLAQPALDLRHVVVVRRHVLDAAESVQRGGVDAIVERQVLEQEREVRREAKHQ